MNQKYVDSHNAYSATTKPLNLFLKNAPKKTTIEPNLPSLMEGNFMLEKQPSGMAFHMINARALEDFGFNDQIAPNFKIAIFFDEDRSQFKFGEHEIPSKRPNKSATVMHFNEATSCAMRVKTGAQRSALYLSTDLDWFERNQLDTNLMKRRLSQPVSFENWTLPDNLWLQAKQMIHLQDQSYISKMAREGFTLSLMSSWLQFVGQEEQNITKPESRRVAQFKELLNSNEVLGMSLNAICHHLGMSSATLQRYANEHLKMSVSQYLRKRKLHLAKTALTTNGLSIMEAALVAGYNHPSNFTTAFKREFGVCPADAYRLL
ncbi:helix-turn-helix domain-containing protein [Reinekea thalattae]|nr:AraC family transcriptional regulator [Reinekea thalattae]